MTKDLQAHIHQKENPSETSQKTSNKPLDPSLLPHQNKPKLARSLHPAQKCEEKKRKKGLPKTSIDFTKPPSALQTPSTILTTYRKNRLFEKQNKKQETKTTTTKTKTEAGTPEPPDLISTVRDLQAAPKNRQIA
jgi:hypothetical protein